MTHPGKKYHFLVKLEQLDSLSKMPTDIYIYILAWYLYILFKRFELNFVPFFLKRKGGREWGRGGEEARQLCKGLAPNLLHTRGLGETLRQPSRDNYATALDLRQPSRDNYATDL